MMLYEVYVDIIREEMLHKNMTQKELCEAVGCTTASMSRYLSYKTEMPFDIAEKCFDVLGYDMDVNPREESSDGC